MIYGPRVTLRAIEREDIPQVNAINNDMEVELAGGGDPPYPQSLARAYAEFDRNAGEGSREGSNFAIAADGHLIGFCGLYRRDEIASTAELGIVIGDKAYWSRGYGRESLALLVNYGFIMLNLRRIYLNVHARNERAIRAYRAVGFVEEGRLRQHVWSSGDYDDLVYMGLLRADWP
ncbi:MAG: GNAT family protein, partial [Chloroflexota bacterium]